MASFRDIPIRRKLAVAIIGTTAASLIAACIAFIVYDYVTFRQTLAAKAVVLADLVAASANTAVDADFSAEATLTPLKADSDILIACLYNTKPSLVASYVRAGVTKDLPKQLRRDGIHFEQDRVAVFRPIQLEDKRVGTIYLQASLEGMRDRLQNYAGISALVLLGALLIAIVLSAGLQRLIARPILNLTEVAQKISEKRDYTVRARKESSDEVGLLTDSFNQMLTDIADRSNALEKANDSLKMQAAQILETVEILNASAKEIMDFTTQVATTATQTASAVGETTATVEEVRQTAHVSSEKARHVSDSAQQAADSSQFGKKATDQTVEGMRNIRQQMELIAQSMVRLSEQSQAIAQIVATVDELAAQSNLLSVNASIEAAKAGEQGKGFAVVAQEVKSLAQQSKQATNQVRAILSDIQNATAAAVMASEQGSKAVETGLKQSTEAGKSILTLTESVTLAAQAASQIAASSQQQLTGMDQVATAMESVKQASLHNVDSAKDLEAAAKKLNELGARLKSLVGTVEKGV